MELSSADIYWIIYILTALLNFKQRKRKRNRKFGFFFWLFVYPYYGAPTYRKNEHGNIQGKSAGIVLRGGIAAVGL